MLLRVCRYALLGLLTLIYGYKAFGSGAWLGGVFPHDLVLFWLCHAAYFVLCLVNAFSSHGPPIARGLNYILAIFAFGSAFHSSMEAHKAPITQEMRLSEATTRSREVQQYVRQQANRIYDAHLIKRRKVEKAIEDLQRPNVASNAAVEDRLHKLLRQRNYTDRVVREARGLRRRAQGDGKLNSYIEVEMDVSEKNSNSMDLLQALCRLEDLVSEISHHESFDFTTAEPSLANMAVWLYRHPAQKVVEDVLWPCLTSIWLTLFAHFLSEVLRRIRQPDVARLFSINGGQTRQKTSRAAV